MHKLTHPGRILVVGAGLAGSAASRVLVRAGHEVELLDAASTPGAGASGNRAGIFKPMLTRTPTHGSQFTFLAFERLLGTLHELEQEGCGVEHSADGLLQLPRDQNDADKLKAALEERRIPLEIARWLETEEASRVLGWSAASGAVWFPRGGWINPADFCRKLISSAEKTALGRFSLKTGIEADLTPERIAERSAGFDAVVFCIAEQSTLLPEFQGIRTQVIRGQLSEVVLPPHVFVPGFPVSFKEYLIPLGERRILLGATHDRNDPGTEARLADHLRLLDRLEPHLPKELMKAIRGQKPTWMRAAQRFTPASRVPVVGLLPVTSQRIGKPAYCLTGLGSRGILTAPLCAEVLLRKIRGEPGPLPGDLDQLVEPLSATDSAADVISGSKGTNER